MQNKIIIENFEIKKQKNWEWIPEQHLILTSTTKRNLKKILPAIQKNQNLLLVGEAGTGKNAIIYYINYLRKQTTIRFSFNEDLLPEDLIGSYRLDPISKTFVWNDGPLVYAMKQGYTFVADEINLTNNDVLKRFQSLFLRRELELLEGNGEVIRASNDFQFIATQNPVEGYEGRKILPREIQKNFVTVWIEPYPKEEIVEILSTLFSDAPLEIVETVVEIHFLLEEWIREKKIGAKDYEKYHFNLRNLKKLFSRFAKENFRNFKEDLRDIFIRQFRDKEEQKKIDELIYEKFKEKQLENILYESDPDQKKFIFFDYDKKIIKIGRKYVSFISQIDLRKFQQELFSNFALTKERIEVICAMVRGIENQENLLLECDSNVEAEEYIQFIGKLYQRPIQWIHLAKGMHTSDVLGGLKPTQHTIEWMDGPLTKAIKENSIIAISGLESAGPELIEKFNMLLDEARAITLPIESGQKEPLLLNKDAIIIGIKYFRKNKNQNTISRAFRNRFTSIVIPEILEIDSIKEIINHFFNFVYPELSLIIAEIHIMIVELAKIKEVGKDRMEKYQFGLTNLYRMLDYLCTNSNFDNGDVINFLLDAFEFSYLNEISNTDEKIFIKEKILNLLSNRDKKKFVQELKELKKKINLLDKKKDFFYKQISWNQEEYFREPLTGKANWNKDFLELQKGIEINTPETGGNIKEGPDAWYGSDTRGNRGVGEVGYGGGAWGYRTEELYKQFLKKRKGLNQYSLGVPFSDFKETFGKQLENIILQLEHLLDPEYFVKRNYQERGFRVNVKKYLAFLNGKGDSRIFDKSIFDKDYSTLKDLEILFLINKGRRIFHFEYSVAILVAMMSVAEILNKHKISFGVFGYSDLENFKKTIDIHWYKKLDEEYTESKEELLYYGIINNWSGDVVQDGKVIEESLQFFSPDVKNKIIIIFSDFRGTRTKIDIHKELKSYDVQYLKKIVEELTKQKITFLGISLGPRNFGEYIFQNSINITSKNYFSLPGILNETLSQMIQNFYFED